MLRITNPVPLFTDGLGNLLDNGQIWIGVVDEDPEANPIQAYWDSALTIPADQPLRTLAGTIRNGATPAQVYIDGTDCSIRISDSNDAPIYYVPSVKAESQDYQPLADALTTIAGQSNTAYGLALLTIANKAALISLLGGFNFLPSSGGTVTGEIRRQNLGTYVFNADPNTAGGAIYVTGPADPDPTVNVGDWWAVVSS